ncbi:MAG: aminotransferase class III-fold pyridoxal phosphate-dependent enzyme [Pseudobacteriovorax sp.]|nr:aminotransferase class III-fold pyridoxal phosphate-dependent enzyme [Pseudobacteriovorax sp.]
MTLLQKLYEIREATGTAVTPGLDDQTLNQFIETDESLRRVIEEARESFEDVRKDLGELAGLGETELIARLQESYVNFYDKNALNPYMALTARGPWIVTYHGAVIYDSGGYGMLGMGHGPDQVIDAMKDNHVMANVMTANISQKRLAEVLNKEIGHTRTDGKHPFQKFVCLNSGSESVTVASRISDVNAMIQTDKGGRHEGKKIRMLAMKGGFHGRTDRPAQASHSSLKGYSKLASFRDRDNLDIVEINNVDALKDAFKRAEENHVFYETLFIEPVMGEGNPGVGVSREFYDAARELTKANNTLLLVDSIQAGLRAQGCLSITDYPGFADCEAPDMETYSKAVNAGQYPLSILALNGDTAALYQKGIYGNTMTTNPRALEVACAVLESVTPELRKNIVDRGHEFVDKFKKLQEEFPDVIENVTGTGLLFAVHLKKDGYVVLGDDCIEAYLRRQGIGVIHGGANALRFTPHFNVSSDEVDLIVNKVREAIARGPVYR